MSTKILSALADAQPLRTIPIPGNPSFQTRTRWHLNGLLNERGERVKLQAWKVGGRLYTTALAIDQFLTRLNCDHVDDGEPVEAVARRGREAGAALRSLGY